MTVNTTTTHCRVCHLPITLNTSNLIPELIPYVLSSTIHNSCPPVLAPPSPSSYFMGYEGE